MISVAEAFHIVIQHAAQFGDESVPLDRALGRVLREPLCADRDFPPFDRVTMDGIAIDFQSFEQGQRQFPIRGIQAAGAPPLHLDDPDATLEVMTGAMLPTGTNTVIRYEDVEIKAGAAHILTDEIKAGQNVHRQGHDRRTGDIIVPAGRKISLAEIGVAATVGKASLLVARLPQVAILYTGDELVDVEATPLPHQIRVSNAHSIQSLLTPWGITAQRIHLPDDLTATTAALESALQQFDVLILSGGVSEGKFDYVPRAMAGLGVQQLFHKVTQRPGKPFWFGLSPNGRPVFALPGNPVSVMAGMMRYVLPWLRQSLGLPAATQERAVLAEDFEFKPNLTYFLQVRVTCSDTAQLMAWPLAGKGSGDLANLVDADAFLELPQERNHFSAGEVFPLWRYRQAGAWM